MEIFPDRIKGAFEPLLRFAVKTIDRQGEVRVRLHQDYEFAYRSVSGPGEEWFLEAVLEFDPAANAFL